MFDHGQTLFCDGCGAEIAWAPVMIDQRHYCCADCADDRPCTCGMQAEWEDERRNAQAMSVEG